MRVVALTILVCTSHLRPEARVAIVSRMLAGGFFGFDDHEFLMPSSIKI